jgi:chemotaxis response regulator CheB
MAVQSIAVEDLDRLAEVLRRRGHTPVLVSNGRDAIDMLRTGFDLVLMDLQMPEMDGFQATAKIRAVTRAAVNAIKSVASGDECCVSRWSLLSRKTLSRGSLRATSSSLGTPRSRNRRRGSASALSIQLEDDRREHENTRSNPSCLCSHLSLPVTNDSRYGRQL